MHGLLRCDINAGVRSCARSGRVTQRCHHRNPRWETGIGSAWNVTHLKRRRIWGILKKSVSWVLPREKKFGCRLLAETLRRMRTCVRWKSQNRKNMYLSPYVEEPLKSKVVKSFVLELRSRKCFSCFDISMYMLYIYIYIYIYISHQYAMSISHIRISGYGTRLGSLALF